jgi:hypothetical protein
MPLFVRFGTSKGGTQDIIIANGILKLCAIKGKDQEGYLRWSAAKALALLRLHRNALDDLVGLMREGRPISDCFECIENAIDD